MAVGPVASGRVAVTSTMAEPRTAVSSAATPEPVDSALRESSRREANVREARIVKGPPPPLFVNGVNMRDVRQLDGNTCYLLATIAALARTRPELLTEAIKDMGAGKFEVRFFGSRRATDYEHDVQQAADVSYVSLTLSGLDRIKVWFSRRKESRVSTCGEGWCPL